MKNKKIIMWFERLIAHYKSSTSPQDKFRVTAYQKSLELIKKYPKQIKNVNDVKRLGKSTKEKLIVILHKGSLDIPEPNELIDVFGIGPKMAKELEKKGIRTIAQLKKNKVALGSLPMAAQLGVKYYDGLSKPITRAKIDAVAEEVRNKLPDHVEVILAGSYLDTKKKTFGDIDMIITSPMFKTREQVIDEDVLGQVVYLLQQAGIIKEIVVQGKEKFIGITSGIHHIDIHAVAYDNLEYHLLYFSGGAEQSKRLRLAAKKLGYKLNEYGLWKNGVRLKISAKEAIKLLNK